VDSRDRFENDGAEPARPFRVEGLGAWYDAMGDVDPTLVEGPRLENVESSVW
jgi:hypothetical protein